MTLTQFLRTQLLFIVVFSFQTYAQTGYPVSELTYAGTPTLNRTIDQSKPVYSIPATITPSEGSAQYQIPVDIPEGINGLAPSVSFGYNSSGGNGLLGYAWHLSGASSISRTGDNFIFDNQVFGAELDSDDRLLMDGQVLILESGSNLTTGSVYKTAFESYQKVTQLSNGGFLVEQKNGTKKYYGETVSSRIDITNGTTTYTLTWLLDEVRDRLGNKILYEYIIDHALNEYRLNKIKYTENEGVQAKAEVEFHYSYRTDQSEGYAHGNPSTSRHILSKIRSTYDGVEYSKYEFKYNWRAGITGEDVSRLVEIQYSSLGADVNSTLVQWNTPQVESSFTTTIYPQYNAGAHGDKVIMDINGDGVDDVLSLEYAYLPDGECDVFGDFQGPLPIGNWEFSVWSNVKDASSPNFARTQTIGPFYSQYKKRNCNRSAFASIHVGDFNGDMLDDFVLLRAQINGAGNSSDNEYYADIYLNDGSSPGTFVKAKSLVIDDHLPFSYEPTEVWKDNNEYSASEYPFSLLVGDFDADGLSDISYLGYTGSTTDENFKYPEFWNIHFFNTDLTTQLVNVATKHLGWGRIDRSNLGDFNGDGKVDVLFRNTGDAFIVVGENRTTWSALYSGTFPTSGNFVRTGDFNSDGISDVLYQPSGADDFYIRHFDGLDFSSNIVDPSINYRIDYKTDFGEPFQSVIGPTVPFVFDADMDTRDDIVFFTQASNSTDFEIVSYYNKVTGWMSSVAPVQQNLVHTADGDDFEVVDFEGTGRPQLFYFENVVNGPNYGFLNTYRPNDVSMYVHQILDGYNRLTEFSYDLLTNSSLYTRSVESYPNPSLMGAYRVIKKIECKDFLGLTFMDQEFEYNNLRINLLGLGFLGYDFLANSELIPGKITETSKDIISGSSGNSWPSMVTKVENKLITGSTISTIDYIYAPTLKKIVGSDFIFETQMARVESKNISLGTSNKVVFLSKDNYGNILSRESYSYNNTSFSSPYVAKEVISTTYTDEGSWVDWQVASLSNSKTRNGQPTISTSKSFSYETTSGNLLQSIINPSTSYEVVTSYTYSTVGNLLSRTITPTGLVSTTSMYTWTLDKRFVETEKNAKGWITKSYVYHPTKGIATKVTDQNNLITEFQHDAFKRIIRVDFPDDNYTETSRHWDVANTFAQSLYYVSISGSNEPDRETWYNGKLLTIREKHKNRNNTWVYKQTRYNSEGLLWKKTLPYFAGGQQQIIVYDYLDDGRISTITTPHKTTTYAYSGLTTTTTSNGISTSQTTDASGAMVSATDNGGTINYVYNSLGQPTNISSTSINVTLTYDAVGNKTSINHSGAGTMTYQYNPLGQITSQNDSRGNTYSMSYDDIGRLTQKSGPDGSYTYIYDSNLKGPLYSVSSPYNNSASYAYDGLGRVSTMTEIVSGSNYEFHYEYDQFSNLTTIHYPNDLSIAYNYDSQGRISDIRKFDDQQLIWQFGDENVMGQITEFDLGPSSTVTKGFDPSTWLPESYENPGITNMSFSFDGGTGNLSRRTNITYGLEEDFSYDSLDRLERQSFTSGGIYLPNGATEINVSYLDDGSIATKGDVGTYQNTNGQTHQITDNPNTISDDQQTITYTPFNSVSTIMEGAFDASFVYGQDNQRRRMTINENGNPIIDRFYLAEGSYERDFTNGSWRNLVYIKTPTGISAVYINDEGQHNHTLYLLDLDHLGSIAGISDATGILVEEYSYDPWGNRRNAQSWENEYNPGQNNNLWSGLLSRGYTGHEHLDCFGLINMNGRVYDPLLGRMLSPDNFVQDAASTQNLNRFSYVLNNPLKYNDPSGEFLSKPFTSFVNGFVKGYFSTGSNRFNTAWNRGIQNVENDFAILAGLFENDPHDNVSAFWTPFNRLTVQGPQTLLGYVSSDIANMLLDVDVSHYNGVTVVKHNRGGGAFTLGPYIIGDRTIDTDPNNILFQHEFGHYLQSQKLGLAYLSYVGIPSFLDALGDSEHDFHPVELDANKYAFEYFNKNVPGFQDDAQRWNIDGDQMNNRGWDFGRNPLDLDGSGTVDWNIDYINYEAMVNNAGWLTQEQRAIWSNYLGDKGKANWTNYTAWFTMPGAISVGIVNWINWK